MPNTFELWSNSQNERALLTKKSQIEEVLSTERELLHAQTELRDTVKCLELVKRNIADSGILYLIFHLMYVIEESYLAMATFRLHKQAIAYLGENKKVSFDVFASEFLEERITPHYTKIKDYCEKLKKMYEDTGSRPLPGNDKNVRWSKWWVLDLYEKALSQCNDFTERRTDLNGTFSIFYLVALKFNLSDLLRQEQQIGQNARVFYNFLYKENWTATAKIRTLADLSRYLRDNSVIPENVDAMLEIVNVKLAQYRPQLKCETEQACMRENILKLEEELLEVNEQLNAMRNAKVREVAVIQGQDISVAKEMKI